jgi:putative nucleotidyltransferase with HDIG domain
MRPQILRHLQDVNREVWFFLMMFGILAATNYLVSSHRMMLGFYVLPSVFSGYFYGRRHATLTAFGSVMLVVLIVYLNPNLFPEEGPVSRIPEKWWDITIWGGTLIVTAYALGTLYEKKEARIRELRETYLGILEILARFIQHDEYTYHHSVRVAAYADTVAKYMGFDSRRREDVKAAALLHDLGKRETSRALLHRAASFTEGEYNEMKKHVQKGVDLVQPVGGLLSRVIPIILAHHDRFGGSGYRPTRGEEIPLEARIISVADAYDAMTSDRVYRKAMSPLDAKDTILKGSGTDFDPAVVKAFLSAYRDEALEIDFSILEIVRQ